MTRPPASRRLRSAIFHALRLPFRALPISDGRRDAMRNWFLDRFPRMRPLAPQGQSPSGPVLERRPRVHSGERAIGYVEYSEEPLPDPLPATLVAFYLPQFHTIPENDEWWGKGFTEWRNVARALPQFEGHLQPRLPGDLGFYDLRNPQVLRDQAKLAQTYGISAFCMYFYWFGGKTLLELPHQQWLNDQSITLPICICWANENWTRTWDGRGDEILIAQNHSPEDDLAFIAHVAQYLRDPRYLRHDGKPMLLVYRPGLLPDAKATAERWRGWCRRNGIGEIHLAYVQSFERPDPRDIGFDAAVEFPPNLSTATDITDRQILLNPDYQGEVLDWRDVADDFANRPMPDYLHFPGINCGWDNEARRPGRGRTFRYELPSQVGDWLSRTLARAHAQEVDRRYVFLNAWNEWSEGAYLEPDARWGYAKLECVRKCLKNAKPPAVVEQASGSRGRTCAIIHAWYPEVLLEILEMLAAAQCCDRIVITTTQDKTPQVREALRRTRLEADILVGRNRGRDVLPFLHALRLCEEYTYILKLHTKLSPHRADGAHWRRRMLASLASPPAAKDAVERFEQEPSLGLLVPRGQLFSRNEHEGGNGDVIRHLLDRLGLGNDLPVGDWHFAAGTMFWARTSALTLLMENDLGDCDFEPERGQLDGTLAHGLERIVCISVITRGYQVRETRD